MGTARRVTSSTAKAVGKSSKWSKTKKKIPKLTSTDPATGSKHLSPAGIAAVTVSGGVASTQANININKRRIEHATTNVKNSYYTRKGKNGKKIRVKKTENHGKGMQQTGYVNPTAAVIGGGGVY